MSTGGKGVVYQLESGPRGKCRRWRLQVSTGKDFATGKYGRQTRVFEGTYTQAQRALREFMAEAESGRVAPSASMTFGEYARRWIETRDVSEATKTKNRNQTKCLTRHLEYAKLSELTPELVESTLRKLRDGDSPSGQPLSGTYLAGIHAMLSRMLKDAVRKGYLASNPCNLTDVPKVDTRAREALNDEQISTLLETLRHDDRNHVACLLALLGGLRRGECLTGLRWKDVDFEKMTMHVHGTKNKASDEIVPVMPMLADVLRDWRCAQEATGCPVTPDTYVLAMDDGEPMEPLSLSRWWARNRDAWGLEGFTFHQLRHSFATMLARQGVHPATMQRLMRHADARTTMQIYTHVSMEQEREAVNILDGALRH